MDSPGAGLVSGWLICLYNQLIYFTVYMNIPIGLVALCLLSWSLRAFELEQTMPKITLAILRSEFVNNFDYVGVLVQFSA